MPGSDYADLTPDDVQEATRTLVRLTRYIRSNPDASNLLPYLVPLVDKYDGAVARLSQALAEVNSYFYGRPELTGEAEDLDHLWGVYSDASEFLLEYNKLDWQLGAIRAEVERQAAAPGRQAGSTS
ncbi:hypothetical protein ACIBEA_14730 [Streptomyces sp. NPDC051555]|uniref:hypothetical protein n=1 Tax=Streptomyces sp. NPDC051555 TaxID=3365657 RepID=UPI003792ADDB